MSYATQPYTTTGICKRDLNSSPPPKKNLSLQYAIKFIQNRRINIQKQFKFRHRFAKKIYMTKTTFN